MDFKLYSSAMLVAGLIALVLAVYSWFRRERSEAGIFAWLMAAVALWSLAYGLELGLRNYAWMRALLVLSYPGIAAIPVLWLLFAIAYCRYHAWLAPRRIFALFLVPILTVVMIVTNDLHNLFYSSLVRSVVAGSWFIDLYHGPFWWLHLVYSHFVTAIGLVIFGHWLARASREERRRILVFLAGAVLPFAVNIAYVAGFRPHGFIDLTPVAFVGMGIVIAYGVFGMRVFDITPLGLEVMFQHIPDAIFMLDNDKRIVKLNSSARQLLESRGLSACNNDVLPVADDRIFFSLEPGQTDLALDDRFFHCIVSLIKDPFGEVIGILVVMRDISIRKQVELEKELTIKQLRQAIEEIKSLRGIIPICASCKKIRDDRGYWQQVEAYFAEHTDAKFSHGICPECIKTLYGEETVEPME